MIKQLSLSLWIPNRNQCTLYSSGSWDCRRSKDGIKTVIYWKYFTRATAVRWSLVCPQNVFPCSFQYEFRKLTCINCKKVVVLLQIHNCRAKKNCFYILSRCSRKPFETSCIAAQQHAMLTIFLLLVVTITAIENVTAERCVSVTSLQHSRENRIKSVCSPSDSPTVIHNMSASGTSSRIERTENLDLPIQLIKGWFPFNITIKGPITQSSTRDS